MHLALLDVLCNGFISDAFRGLGNLPVEKQRLNMETSSGDIDSEDIFMNLIGILVDGTLLLQSSSKIKFFISSMLTGLKNSDLR